MVTKTKTQSQTENYEHYLWIGLVLTLLLLGGFSYYWLAETARLDWARQELTNERVSRGRNIYAQQCIACHGRVGEGSLGPPLNSRDLLKNTLDDVLFSVIRSGVPNTRMPAWSVDYGGPLTDEDILDVVAFIRAWEPTAPVIEPVVFAPDAGRGAVIYTNSCEICHGADGRGTENVRALNDQERLSTLDDDWYRDTINNGRPSKGMPTWGTILSPNQIEDLIALFDVWQRGETVQAAYSSTDLLKSAVFSLEEGDPESALLQVQRALEVVDETSAVILRDVEAKLLAGDDAEALVILSDLYQRWPIGDPELGAELFASKCSACHGDDGEGGMGVPLHPNQFIQEHTNAELVAFVQSGRTGTAMAGFRDRLTEQEIAHIIAFLRQWQEE